MSLKTLIFFGLLAVALGFTLPEGQFDDTYAEPEWANGDVVPMEDSVVLIRRARSPQDRRLNSKYSHSRRMGSSASVDYTHPINKNWEAYATGSRNFKYNDNSGHAGLRFKF